jgi:serine/threonine protein kinase
MADDTAEYGVDQPDGGQMRRRYLTDQETVNAEEMLRLAREGKYEIRERLARGAESVLYLATCGSAQFCVKAIRNRMSKTIGCSQTRSDEGKLDVSYRSKVRHLKNEFQIGREFANEDVLPVVRIYSLRKVRRFGVQLGYDLLMEYIDGKDLGDRLFLRELSLEQKIDIFYQTTKALQFVHSRRYIHLDLKPSNIMVSDGRVKLIDFGVTVSQGTKPRSVTGTAGYLSPEQIVREYLDEATDIFSLGVTFASVFGGKPLRQNAADLKNKSMRMEAQYHLENLAAPMVTDMPEALEVPELARLLQECTVARRDKRINSCATILTTLRRVADSVGMTLTE